MWSRVGIRRFTGTISSLAVSEKTAKDTRKRWFLGIKTTNCRPGHFYTFYSWQIFEIFVIHSQKPKLKTILFLFFKMLYTCWYTRVQSYPNSASKIKSTNCLAWPHLYFLFMADRWNFCGKFISLAVPEKTAKKHPKKFIYGYQNQKFSDWPVLYFLFMADVWKFCDKFLRP